MSFLSSLLPAVGGFLLGGPLGAAMGLEGTAASVVGGALAGGATSSLTGGDFTSGALGGGLGGYGGTFSPSDLGFGSAGIGSSMGGAGGLTFGGAGGLGLTGAGLSGLESMGGAGGLMGGLSTPALDAAGMSLGGVGAGGGTMADLLRQRMAMMGMGGGLGGGLNIASGLYGLNAAQQMSQMASRADPFGAYRPGYAAQLQQLTADPSRITSAPGYNAGLQAVQRSMAAQGYQGSGNMMAALQKYGGDFYGQEVNRLASLGGANISPAIALQGQGMASDLASRGLASLGYGTRMLGI